MTGSLGGERFRWLPPNVAFPSRAMLGRSPLALCDFKGAKGSRSRQR